MNARLKLTAIAALLEPGVLPDAEREWLLEQSGGPGQRTFRTIQRHRRRAELLRETAARFWPGLSRPEQARQLNVGLSRYRETAWRYERALVECPARLRGTQQEMYWLILKQVDAVLAAATIRDILRGS